MMKAILSLVVLCVLFPAGPAAGQPNPTTWDEALSFDIVPGTPYSESGDSTAVPEPFSTTFNGLTYSYSGSVSFDPGPPNATCQVAWDYQSGLTAIDGSAYCRIEFQFWVRQSSAPPVPVTGVPVNVMASGSVQVTGDGSLYASGYCYIDVSTILGPLLSESVFVENTSSPSSDTFNLNQQLSLATNSVVSCDMSATAAITAFEVQNNLSATAFAYIDPVIEVADQTIPGSSASYRDHFVVEFGSGYVVPGSTPTRRTTWGRIKDMYRN